MSYALIMVLYTINNAHLTVINQDLNSFETCEVARKFIENDVSKNPKISIVSQGCHKK